MSINVAARLHEQAARRPADPAIITDNRVIDYAELARLVGALAHFLRAQGIAAGEVVGISMAQIPLHLMAILALAQVGAVSVPLHPLVPRERRRLAAERFGARWVISGRDELALDGLRFADLKQVSFETGCPTDTAIHPSAAGDPMRIAISSGTSGDPKGVLLTHGMAALRNRTIEAGAAATSRTIPMDLNFIVGFRPALSALDRGAALVFPPSFAADAMLRAMIDHKVTHVYLSPVQARAIVAAAVAGMAGPACPDLVCLRIGGGPAGPELLRAVATRLSPNVYVSYGSTESGMLTYATPQMLTRHPDTVGSVCDWANIEVVGADARPLPPGATGEIRIRSTHQVDGYYRDEARSRRHFRDGWFYPGDLARFDADGLLYVDGRVDEQINVGGLKINPFDVETTLARHPAVAAAGAFAALGDAGHEELAVALVLDDGARLDEVRRYAVERLGPLAPQRWFLCANLPRTETGKLKRGELAARYSADAVRL